jgi:hypothetical protein
VNLLESFKTALASIRKIGLRQKNTSEFNEKERKINVFAHTSRNINMKTLAFRDSTMAKGRKHITVEATTIAQDLAIFRFCNFFT